MRILLAEDDLMIGEAMKAALTDAAYGIDWITDGHLAIEALATTTYDMVLLDLGLPRKDGLSVLARLRASGNTVPVLIITARDAIEDRIAGLDGGADDYIVKPFDMSELLARIRANSRRQAGSAGPALSNGVVSLDVATKTATTEAGDVQLSAREFALLHALLVRPGALLSRAEIEDRIYGWGNEVESNAVEFIIHALRRKLGREVIRNVRGVGWCVGRTK
ncbi:response regulator [Nitrogeniibacter mangrovi]|uniref:Response regulator n=1 Tax=Nitrogeniibacter mangrovi TaxID=2016596 RepID=A0A6C1B6G7_9RHOO|nr:response regulator [Nitrogeniibacter mangrovi]QID18308.1 response regulator [Nitrogeniibacter mangrovi]